MNKLTTSLITASVLIGISSSPITLAKDGFLNGKPFEYLKSQVDANADAITDLNQITSDLTADILTINTAIEAIEGDVADSKLDIQNMNNALTLLEEAIDANSDNIDTLRTNINTLRTEHEADIALLLTTIEDLRESIANLRESVDAALGDLGDTIEALQAEVDSNTSNVQELMISTLNALADIVAMQAILDDHEARLVDAESHLTSIDVLLADISTRLNNIDLRLAGIENTVDVLEDYHFARFTGVQNDVPIDSLNGWSLCFSALYSENTATTGMMQSQCTKTNLIVACRATGDSVLRVMAQAPRADVFHEDGDGRETSRLVNGAQWYFSNNYSMGFAPQGEAVYRFSADTLNPTSNDRLSWHTHTNINIGWRCGDQIGDWTSWEKLIFESDF